MAKIEDYALIGDEMSAAAQELAMGHYQQAIGHYKNAWQAAETSLPKR